MKLSRHFTRGEIDRYTRGKTLQRPGGLRKGDIIIRQGSRALVKRACFVLAR